MQTTKWKVVAFITVLLCFFLISTKAYGAEDTDVTAYFKDENLKNAILEIIRDVEGDESKNNITTSDIAKITSDDLPSGKQLNLAGKNITDLSGLQLFLNKGIEWIYLDWNNISDMSILSSFSTLTKISASGNQVTDISFLQNLKNLQNINFNNNKITNIDCLKNLANLKYVYLDNNQIQNISGLSNLNNLREISIAGNKITDAGLLTNLESVENIDISRNNIASISNFSNNATIQKINLNYNQLVSLQGIENITNLEILSASNNKITDISYLKNLNKLYNLNLNKNEINDISVFTDNSVIEYLYLDANHILDTNSLENLSNISRLTIYNQTYTQIITEDFNEEQIKVILTPIFSSLVNPNSKIYNSEIYCEMEPSNVTCMVTEDLSYFVVKLSHLQKQDLIFSMKDDNNTYISLILQYRVQEDTENNEENTEDSADTEPEESISDVYTVTEEYIKNVPIKTTLDVFMQNLKVISDAKVTRDNNELTNNDFIGTGDILTANGKTYTIIVTADPSGDGKASIIDLMRAKKYIIGSRTLSTNEQLALDLNSDGKINITDVMRLIKIIIN